MMCANLQTTSKSTSEEGHIIMTSKYNNVFHSFENMRNYLKSRNYWKFVLRGGGWRQERAEVWKDLDWFSLSRRERDGWVRKEEPNENWKLKMLSVVS